MAARDLRGLEALAEERSIRRALCVTREPRPRRVGKVSLMPYGDFLDALWAGDLGG